MEQNIRVYFVQGYNGGVKAGVYIDDVEYVIELDWLKEFLEKMILEKGYKTSITNRQKYPRLTINN